MKLLFVVSSIHSRSKGLGGHFYSLIETISQLENEHTIYLINIGTFPSQALKACNIKSNIKYIIHEKIAFYKIYKSLRIEINNFNPDILHAFDINAFLWVRLFANKIKICITKCGGVNQQYYPYSPHLIMFSQENINYYKKKSKFKNSDFYLIPNRIKEFSDDNQRIRELTKLLGISNKFKILRISRIGEYYKKSLIQMINLINDLSKDNIDCCGIIIGTIEDNSTFEILNNLANGKNVYIINEKFYTSNAKELIAISDAVIGTGRSFMEAAAKEKVLLVPGPFRYPVVMSDSNFVPAFFYNFSERIIFPDFDESNNYSEIKALIGSSEKQEKSTSFAKEIFQEYFDSKMIPKKYNHVYDSLPNTYKDKMMDLLINFIYVLRVYLKKSS